MSDCSTDLAPLEMLAKAATFKEVLRFLDTVFGRHDAVAIMTWDVITAMRGKDITQDDVIGQRLKLVTTCSLRTRAFPSLNSRRWPGFGATMKYPRSSWPLTEPAARFHRPESVPYDHFNDHVCMADDALKTIGR